MNKIILITGATSGFGKAMAETFAAARWNCILTGRRAERLHAFAEELAKTHGIQTLPLVFDVQKRAEVFTALDNLPEEWKAIDVLVNNAGLALGRDSFENADLDDWDTMMDTNVKGMMYVTKAVLPYMTARKKGHIINMGSVAGKEVYKDGNGYCASKYAVDALSKSMRIDLLPHRIKVTAIHRQLRLSHMCSYVRHSGTVLHGVFNDGFLELDHQAFFPRYLWVDSNLHPFI